MFVGTPITIQRGPLNDVNPHVTCKCVLKMVLSIFRFATYRCSWSDTLCKFILYLTSKQYRRPL